MMRGQGADMFDAWGHGRDWQLINCLNARVLSQNVCLSLITRRSWTGGNQRSKQWHTRLAHTGGMRGHARHTGECPDPGSLPGVSCRANITSQHHHHHTSSGDEAGHLSYSAQHTVSIRYQSQWEDVGCLKSRWSTSHFSAWNWRDT